MTTAYPPHADDEPADPVADLLEANRELLAALDSPPDEWPVRTRRMATATGKIRRAVALYDATREEASRDA